MDDHVRALSSKVAKADSVTIVLTHGHADHAASAGRLSRLIGAEVMGPRGIESVTRILADGAIVATDRGDLVAMETPGHTREHLAFHWPERSAVFVGDLLLGRGDTTWVAEYRGCVADYLRSLERLRLLNARVLYPTHGPALTDSVEALDRFERHRRDRIEQVRAAREARPGADAETLVELVYGDAIPKSMRGAALQSLTAIVDYLDDPLV